MTEWDEFRRLKSKDYIAYMKAPVLVDARRIYDPLQFQELKFASIGFGSEYYTS
jgi:UDPglucose 6-dehydrogenase